MFRKVRGAIHQAWKKSGVSKAPLPWNVGIWREVLLFPDNEIYRKCPWKLGLLFGKIKHFSTLHLTWLLCMCWINIQKYHGVFCWEPIMFAISYVTSNNHYHNYHIHICIHNFSPLQELQKHQAASWKTLAFTYDMKKMITLNHDDHTLLINNLHIPHVTDSLWH